jgi:hypothetical protein
MILDPTREVICPVYVYSRQTQAAASYTVLLKGLACAVSAKYLTLYGNDRLFVRMSIGNRLIHDLM